MRHGHAHYLAKLDFHAERDPNILADFETLCGQGTLTERIETLRHITEQILAPIGGAWRKDEILYFAARRTTVHALGNRLAEAILMRRMAAGGWVLMRLHRMLRRGRQLDTFSVFVYTVRCD